MAADKLDIKEALTGKRIGVQGGEDVDVLDTGVLEVGGTLTNDQGETVQYYKTIIKGTKLTLDQDGKVIETYPPNDAYMGKTLEIKEITTNQTYGSGQNQAEEHEGYTTAVNLATMEVRDHFALQALSILLHHKDNAEHMDDANRLFYCDMAYQWANSMMVAAAKSRLGTKEESGGGGDTQRNEVDVSTGSVSEKLMDNIVKSVDDLTKQMKENKTQATTDNLALIAKLGDTFKIDNPKDDKFEIEGGGGGGIDYDKLNDIKTNASSIVGFNDKAAGRTSVSDLLTKLISSLDDTQKASLYTAIKSKIGEDFDAKGAAAQALTDAKKYTDDEIAKKHPST